MINTTINNENIKLTVIDDVEHSDDCYFEVIVNQNFINTVVLSFLLLKNSVSDLDIYLTQREEEILYRIAKGKDNGRIAKEMNISIHTVKVHIKNIFQKLNVKDRTEAVVMAIKYGLIDVFNE